MAVNTATSYKWSMTKTTCDLQEKRQWGMSLMDTKAPSPTPIFTAV